MSHLCGTPQETCSAQDYTGIGRRSKLPVPTAQHAVGSRSPPPEETAAFRGNEAAEAHPSRERAAALSEALGREERGRAGGARHAHVVARELVADAEVGDLHARRYCSLTILNNSVCS